jgi:hypothetical protein
MTENTLCKIMSRFVSIYKRINIVATLIVDADRTLLPEQTSFYKNLVSLHEYWLMHSKNILGGILIGISQAASAVHAGVCVDLFDI